MSPIYNLPPTHAIAAAFRLNHQSCHRHLKLGTIFHNLATAFSYLFLSIYLSPPLSLLMSRLRKDNFFSYIFWFFGLYIEIFYYNNCLEVEKNVRTSRECVFLEDVQKHNQTLKYFPKHFFEMQLNT